MTAKPTYADLARAPAKKVVRRKDEAVASSDSDDPWAPEPYQYKRPKARVVTSALFMWAEVASFCEPKEVCKLETVSADVRQSMQESRKGTKVMNRYWNAQWSRLLWADDQIPAEKKLLLPTSLTRSEGKKNWKKAYVEEYPAWLQRTFQGVGVRNNATNEAKVRFHGEQLNKHYTAEQMKGMELSVEEALSKAQTKRGVVTLEGEEANGEAGASGATGAPGLKGVAGAASPTGNGKPLIRMPVKDLSQGYERADYKDDPRAGTRKGKHKKGGTKKWSGFATMEEDY